MRSRGIYVLCMLITAAVMAAGLFVPYLRIPQGADTDVVQTESSEETGVAESDSQALSFFDKIQAVGSTIIAREGYKREKTVGGYIYGEEAASQFLSVIDKLYEHSFIDEKVYTNLATNNCSAQAVTEYNYMRNSQYIFTVRVIERTYENIGYCPKMTMFMGIDRETAQLIYLYLNFYGLGSGFDFNSIKAVALSSISDNWTVILGMNAAETGILTNEIDFKNSLRVHATYKMEDSSALHYKFGFSYDNAEDRYQIFAEPAVIVPQPTVNIQPHGENIISGR